MEIQNKESDSIQNSNSFISLTRAASVRWERSARSASARAPRLPQQAICYWMREYERENTREKRNARGWVKRKQPLETTKIPTLLFPQWGVTSSNRRKKKKGKKEKKRKRAFSELESEQTASPSLASLCCSISNGSPVGGEGMGAEKRTVAVAAEVVYTGGTWS